MRALGLALALAGAVLLMVALDWFGGDIFDPSKD